MSRLAQLRSLSAADRRLLTRAFVLVATARLRLAVFPLHRISSLAHSLNARPGAGPHTPERIAWAVGVAGRYVPFSTCLAEAFAGHVLLRRNGWPSVIRIGVSRNATEGFRAHAWVECGGTVAVGAAEAPGFAPIVRIG
jgi:hypothetical protein